MNLGEGRSVDDDPAFRFAVEYLSKHPLTPEANIAATDQTRIEIGDYLFEDYQKNLTPEGVSRFRGWAADFIENMNSSYGQDRILRRVIQRFIESDEPLPPELRDYFKREPLPKPVKTKRGPSPREKAYRNAAIVSCVAELRDRFGVKVSRNDATRGDGPETACSIVARALNFLRVAMSEHSVEKIWFERAKVPY